MRAGGKDGPIGGSSHDRFHSLLRRRLRGDVADRLARCDGDVTVADDRWLKARPITVGDGPGGRLWLRAAGTALRCGGDRHAAAWRQLASGAFRSGISFRAGGAKDGPSHRGKERWGRQFSLRMRIERPFWQAYYRNAVHPPAVPIGDLPESLNQQKLGSIIWFDNSK
jgi:hypothetical protein